MGLGRVSGHKGHNSASVSLTQVQRPLLPTHAAIAPYLDRIDASRWYSNRGPLVWELEKRLGAQFGAEEFSVALLSNGTAAIEAAILAHAGAAPSERPLALMPAYSFVATAQAAMRCGYTPFFLDVDPETWMLDPGALAFHPALERAGVVITVAAYGKRPDIAAWEAFQDQTGCPVVVDAAASFEQFEREPGLISADLPVTLSLHATKAFSTAEGGAGLWRAPKGWLRSVLISNFGMSDARRCEFDGFNGKLSDYHAAVGLAQLDQWGERRARLAAVAECYQAAARAAGPLPGTLRTTPEVSGAYVLFDCNDDGVADRVCARLAEAGIGSRRWYGRGLHLEPFLAARGHDDLPVTEALSATHIGLPGAVDLTEGEITMVVDILARTG
ncbi:MAG: hypothetical protein CML65_04765 [Rhodobacteraceae bacterium]|nr:hypothetical protein [Paracoccaceae bacterium]